MNERVREIEAKIDFLERELSAARRLCQPEVIADHRLRDLAGQEVTLRSLFGTGRDLIILHNMGRRCVYCTMWADGFAGSRAILESRTALVLVTPDEPGEAAEFARARGWPLRVVSQAGTTFGRDLGFEPKPGEPQPGASGLRLRGDGTIVRTGVARFKPRDSYCPAWHLFDLLEGGVGAWEPRFSYA